MVVPGTPRGELLVHSRGHMSGDKDVTRTIWGARDSRVLCIYVV